MACSSIGIVAPSSVVPKVEFALGVGRLRQSGFFVKVHPRCRDRYLFFAGKDRERAEAFLEHAFDPSLSVIWCARGGYGAIRMLPWLKVLTEKTGAPPPKLLAGFSDATVLLDFVRRQWNWSTIHAPMPGIRDFALIQSSKWKNLIHLVNGESVAFPAGNKRLHFFKDAPKQAVSGELVGGNLTVWASLVGTPFQPQVRGKILFFEDIGESLYRIDRMVQQLLNAGGFDGIRGIVLGEFEDCEDSIPRVLKSPRAKSLQPLRPIISQNKGFSEIFGVLGRRLGIPVAYGLPVGHGRGQGVLPLGAQYHLSADGELKLLRWDWLDSRS